MSETHEFQTETQRVLDIVINSLYTDKDIFVRELVSNASDALEKLRHTQITEKKIHDDNLSLEINITTDDKAGILTIQDFGIGMTRDELVENLGTIAHSGSKKFLETMEDGDDPKDNLIGQFGVGFYSTFMVADKVKVYTHSWDSKAPGFLWESEGAGNYTIDESEGQRRGTKIVVHLKKDCKDFAGEDRVKQIIKQYSSFVQFPINLNGERVNTVDAIWLRNKSEIKDEEYTEFYKFQSNAFDEPLLRMHFNADAPISINALLFIPKENTERFGFGKMEQSVALHCRKVMIDSEPKGLLPDWLRFLKGVVDSADLPLNISRETMQDSALIQKLNSLITKRFQRPTKLSGISLVSSLKKAFTLIMATAINSGNYFAMNLPTPIRAN
jgi:molecular chaperone HtpG